MADWERLTPEGHNPSYTPADYRRRTLGGSHELSRGPYRFYLSDAELLALARRCDEVQALAKACRAAPTITGAELNALAPFEDT